MSESRFNLSAWALKHQSLVLYFMVVFSIAGVFSYLQLGQKEDPEFTFKAMVVRAYWPGATADEVEEQLTDKLEKALQGVEAIDYVQSYSRAGESQLVVFLRKDMPGRDVPAAWYQVRKRIGDNLGDLPSGIVGPVFNDEFGDTFGNLYAFTGDGFTLAELKPWVERVRDELLRIPEINKIELVGEQDEKIYIEYSQARLANLGVTPQQIGQLLAATNAVSPAGVVEGRQERVYLRVTGHFATLAQLRQLPLTVNGRTFRLGDVATLHRQPVDPPAATMRFQGQPALGLAISMRKGGDVLDMGKKIDATLRQVRATLPVGIEFHAVSDQPAVVKNAIHVFMKSLLEAVVIVLAVSFLSLGLRTGIVVALSIPLVLLMTFLGMKLCNIELQRVSLGALVISLGLLVDDAIIAVEMMALKLEQGWDRFRAATFAYTSTAFPMLTGTLITAAGFLPVGMAKSDAGEYTFSIFAVVGLALLLSWIVAVAFTPYLGFKLLPEQVRHEAHDVYQTGFYVRFRRIVSACIVWRKTTIAATVFAFALALALFAVAVPKQFFPPSNRPELLINLWLPYTASFAATEREVKHMEDLLRQDPDVLSVTSYVGQGSPRFYLPLNQQLPTLNFAEMMVMTRDEKVRDQVLARINRLFETDFPLVRGRVITLENGPPVGLPVQFRLSGPNATTLHALAAQVGEAMRAHPGTRLVHTDWGEKVKILRLVADQDRLRALGISSKELAERLQIAFSGVTATQFRDGRETIDVVSRMTEGERTRLDQLDALRIHLPSGRSVPVRQLVQVEYAHEESIIWRRNRMRTLTVMSDVMPGYQAPDVANAVFKKLQPLIAALPAGYHLEIGGTLESSKKSEGPIMAVIPAMLLIVTTLLMLQLQSMQRTAMVLLTAPLGIIGVTPALLLFNAPFGFVAMLGVIALAGMIMRNSVILMDQIEQDRLQGASTWGAVVESAVRRFRPIMLTAAAAILAMIPLARDSFWGPMAIAIMGGLLVATVLTLLFLPALYALWYRVHPETDA